MQYYTLDEASKKLGLGVDEFRKRLATEWKTLRRFPDGATLRFQSRDIDELARKIGRSSDPDLQIGEAPLSLAEEPAPAIAKAKPKADETLFLPPEQDEDFVPLAMDDPSTKKGKSGSDSDVKLEKTSGGTVRPVAGGDEETEMLDVPKAPLKSFDLRSDEGKKKTRITSEFELSLNADDDFNLDLTDDSDEVPLGKSGRKGSRRGTDSGINLADPADSGISLEKDSSDFELALEGDLAGPKTPPAKTGPKTPPVKGGPKTTPPVAAKSPDADSEFELSLEDGSDPNAAPVEADDQKDIFETDFELPAIDDSSSEEQSPSTDLAESDFDLSVDDDSSLEESASEVVEISEEAAEEDLEPIVDEEEVASPVAVAPAVSADWGPLPVLALAPCTLIMFFVGLMGLELLSSMWGFSSPARGTGPIVKAVAGLFGEVKD